MCLVFCIFSNNNSVLGKEHSSSFRVTYECWALPFGRWMPYYTNAENRCLHNGSVQDFLSLESKVKWVYLLPSGCKWKHLCNSKDLKMLLLDTIPHRKKGSCPVVRSKGKICCMVKVQAKALFKSSLLLSAKIHSILWENYEQLARCLLMPIQSLSIKFALYLTAGEMLMYSANETDKSVKLYFMGGLWVWAAIPVTESYASLMFCQS